MAEAGATITDADEELTTALSVVERLLDADEHDSLGDILPADMNDATFYALEAKLRRHCDDIEAGVRQRLEAMVESQKTVQSIVEAVRVRIRASNSPAHLLGYTHTDLVLTAQCTVRFALHRSQWASRLPTLSS